MMSGIILIYAVAILYYVSLSGKYLEEARSALQEQVQNGMM